MQELQLWAEYWVYHTSAYGCPVKGRYLSVADLGYESWKPIFYSEQWHHNGSKNITFFASRYWSHAKVIPFLLVTSKESKIGFNNCENKKIESVQLFGITCFAEDYIKHMEKWFGQFSVKHQIKK